MLLLLSFLYINLDLIVNVRYGIEVFIFNTSILYSLYKLCFFPPLNISLNSFCCYCLSCHVYCFTNKSYIYYFTHPKNRWRIVDPDVDSNPGNIIVEILIYILIYCLHIPFPCKWNLFYSPPFNSFFTGVVHII